MVTRFVGALAAVVVALCATACNTEATKDASVPCSADSECAAAAHLTCLPTRNGLSGECLQPACSKPCNADSDCAGMRYSSDNKECFACRDVAGCPGTNGQPVHGEAGADGGAPFKVCVDRCENVTPH